MNPVEIGRKFEAEALVFLKKQFDEVKWLSKEKWHNSYDFDAFKNGRKFKIEAKSNLSNCRKDKEVNCFD